MSDCTHQRVTGYTFADNGEPAGLWACIDCRQRFEPLTPINYDRVQSLAVHYHLDYNRFAAALREYLRVSE